MPKTTFVQTNFTAGEVSPRLYGRTDLTKYGNGVALQKNFITMKHGGAVRRPGTKFVAEVKDSTKTVRLIPFQFSTVQAYVLEFGEEYIRFYRGNGRVESPPGTPVEVSSPYQEDELKELKYTQSADILFITHENHEPMELQRTSDTSWALVEYDYKDGPYLPTNTGVTTLNPSATTGAGITITASAVTDINDGDGFKSTDVGRLVRIEHGGEWGYAKITAFTDTTHVTADVKEDFDAATAQTSWRLGAWSDTTGWPVVCEFHHQRLWFAGTTDKPQTLWASVVGDFENFEPTAADGTVADDDGLTYTIDDDEVNAVRWLVSGVRGLMIGTEDAEFIGAASSAFDPITPSNFRTSRHSFHGSDANVGPQPVGIALLFCQHFARKVREFVYSFDQDQFVAPDLTILSEHITQTKIIDSAYQQEPNSVYWALLTDGTLIGCTYEREQEVIAWHRHVIGGRIVE